MEQQLREYLNPQLLEDGGTMQMTHKGYCIELTSTCIGHAYMAQAVIRASTARHARRGFAVRSSGAMGRFSSPDEAVIRVLNWAFLEIDGGR